MSLFIKTRAFGTKPEFSVEYDEDVEQWEIESGVAKGQSVLDFDQVIVPFSFRPDMIIGLMEVSVAHEDRIMDVCQVMMLGGDQITLVNTYQEIEDIISNSNELYDLP